MYWLTLIKTYAVSNSMQTCKFTLVSLEFLYTINSFLPNTSFSFKTVATIVKLSMEKFPVKICNNS